MEYNITHNYRGLLTKLYTVDLHRHVGIEVEVKVSIDKVK